jgi:drug/metabolite transporter (DMT)-like permease
LVSGIFLALHFATWITSLEHTSVVSSVVLVTTTPLWVAALAPLVLRERINRNTWVGIGLATAGGIIIGVGDIRTAGAALSGASSAAASGGARSGHVLFGDFLALSGAWMMAGYLLVGRSLRSKMSLIPYIFVVYGMAALVLVMVVLITGQELMGIPIAAWGWILLLALIPQLLGHSSFNWALRYLPAAFVAIVLLGEPIGSAVLAYIVLGELPGGLTLIGATLVLAGILIAWRAAGREALADA